MYPVLEDGTVGPVPIEAEAGEHRGLLVAVMERGTMGYWQRGEIDFDEAGQIFRVGIPENSFDLWGPMLAKALALVQAMGPQVMSEQAARIKAEYEALVERERVRLEVESEQIPVQVDLINRVCPFCGYHEFHQPQGRSTLIECNRCTGTIEGGTGRS
jgi:hypothetical protein